MQQSHFAPKQNTSIRNAYSAVVKKVKSGQANNVVINLKDSKITVNEMKKQILDWPYEGLKQVIIIGKGNSVTKVK